MIVLFQKVNGVIIKKGCSIICSPHHKINKPVQYVNSESKYEYVDL